jgi:hypothetical protein
MTYFTESDYQLLQNELDINTPKAETLREQMLNLHRQIYGRMTEYRINLFPNPETQTNVTQETLATPYPKTNTLSLIYTRSRAQAVAVENLMGRDGAGIIEDIRAQHHPAIEIRLSADYLAIELILAPTAWYDQQNLIGKLTFKQHRDSLHKLLEKLPKACVLGFWSGITPSDAHINLTRVPPKPLLYDFFDTFSAGRDWLRVGYWYQPNQEEVSANNINNTLLNHIQSLYRLYNFVTWTSDNNFRSFYVTNP